MKRFYCRKNELKTEKANQTCFIQMDINHNNK